MGVTQFRAPGSPQRPPPAPQRPELWPAWLPRRGARPGLPRGGAARALGAAASTRQAPPPERPLSQLPPPPRLRSRLPHPGLQGPSELGWCSRCLLEDLSSPASPERPAPCSLLLGAPSGAGMWAIVGGTEAAVGATRGFFIWQLLPPCLSRARPGGLQKSQLLETRFGLLSLCASG